jgi:hypothetical protein
MVGLGACFVAMLGIYYGNGWNSRSLPFMSTRLLNANGTAYPVSTVFPGGVLDEAALLEQGLPKLTGTFAFAMFMANAAVRTAKVLCSQWKLIKTIDRRLDRSLYFVLGK